MKFKRFLVLMCVCSLCICMAANVKAKADSFPAASEILTLLPGVDLTGITNAYEGLTSEQKLVANYIIGAFNNIYLCARGFTYNIEQNETAYKAQFLAMGEMVFQYATTQYGWKSRFNEVFRQYLSSAIVYASNINTTFEVWYQSVKQGGANQLYIPYSQEAFDAWTEWYNDPSGDGIASLGETISEWDSGNSYDFAWTGYAWSSASYQTNYNNFILNHNPVLFTNVTDNGTSYLIQTCLDASDFFPDTLFVLRNANNAFQYARYGFSNMTVLNSQISVDNIVIMCRKSNSQLSTNNYGIYSRHDTINYGSGTSIDNLLNYAFSLTPYVIGLQSLANSYYPYVEHVILVDNLSTLSNPEEIYNIEGLDIIAPPDAEAYYITSPNGLFLSPIWPTADGDPMGFWDIVQDNSFNVDTQLPATDDDFKKTIINNTTINNYYVTDSDKINVPVEWFENELTDQLAQDSIPFLQFARDCIDCLGDLQIYLYGAVVFGLAGGIIKKFLL